MKLIKFFYNNALIFIFTITFTLLIINLFSIGNLTINNNTLILLIVLIIIPLLPNIKKIKLGDFEAERFSNDVEQFDIQAEKVKNDHSEIAEESNEIISRKALNEEISQLLNNDHVIALAKLRIELERIINNLYIVNVPFVTEFSLMKKIRTLQQKQVIDNRVSQLLFEVIKICNQAVHAQEVSKNQAEIIVDHGLWLLNQLSSISFLRPKDVKIITDEERIKFTEQKYIVKTVTPYVTDPKMNTYIMTQKDLDDFLDGYSEYAEFLVEITKYDDSK